MYKLLFLLLFLCSCSTMQFKGNPDIIYKHSVKMNINGKSCVGTCVVKRATYYSLQFTVNYKSEVVRLSTNHRDVPLQDQSKKISYLYVPSIDPDEINSQLKVGIFNSKGQHEWGLIDFENEDTTLEARVLCNGEKQDSKGVSICQSQSGLTQMIVFETPVKAYWNERCAEPVTSTGKEWIYDISRGRCVYLFATDGKRHRHSTLGYDDVVISE